MKKLALFFAITAAICFAGCSSTITTDLGTIYEPDSAGFFTEDLTFTSVSSTGTKTIIFYGKDGSYSVKSYTENGEKLSSAKLGTYTYVWDTKLLSITYTKEYSGGAWTTYDFADLHENVTQTVQNTVIVTSKYAQVSVAVDNGTVFEYKSKSIDGDGAYTSFSQNFAITSDIAVGSTMSVTNGNISYDKGGVVLSGFDNDLDITIDNMFPEGAAFKDGEVITFNLLTTLSLNRTYDTINDKWNDWPVDGEAGYSDNQSFTPYTMANMGDYLAIVSVEVTAFQKSAK